MVGLLLVTVIVVGFGGVCEREAVLETSRPWPVVTDAAALMGVAVTVAVICWELAVVGVENPAGVTSEIFDVPAPTGWKLTVALDALLGKIAGLFVMVPTAVLELVTPTLTPAAAGVTVP